MVSRSGLIKPGPIKSVRPSEIHSFKPFSYEVSVTRTRTTSDGKAKIKVVSSGGRMSTLFGDDRVHRKGHWLKREPAQHP